mmetsp:Transcript_25237/g.59875  ORF Transcript_25237/g.59875 Transcript_25237/m.59875 type:complete len:81 (+) Transcript_25237:612-854(+)
MLCGLHRPPCHSQQQSSANKVGSSYQDVGWSHLDPLELLNHNSAIDLTLDLLLSIISGTPLSVEESLGNKMTNNRDPTRN